MEGLEKIKDKIMNDANQRAAKILSESDNEIHKLKHKYQNEMSQFKTEFDSKTAAMLELHKQKNLAKARLVMKKEILHLREKLIDDFIRKATEDFAGDKYRKFIEGILKKNSSVLGDNMEVFCNKKDVNLVKELSDDNHLNLQISEMNIDGGLIFRDTSGKKIDESLHCVLETKKNEIRQRVSQLLKA